MALIRARLSRVDQRLTDPGSDAGLTLIEVMFALMIFAIISVSVAFSLTSSLVSTRDSKAREVAANLAAQDIDNARSTSDVVSVRDKVFTQTIDGIDYTVTRSTGWVTNAGASSTCGLGGSGSLLYKHVNEWVTWTGARTSTTGVQSDTLISSSGRLNDPTMGTIFVSVLSANGAGVGGVTVSVSPADTNPNGATIPGTAPTLTDNDGCSYTFKASAGNYKVSISSLGGNYVSNTQLATVSKPNIQVTTGDSTAVAFQYDLAGNFDVTYGSNGPAATVQFPTALPVNFVNSTGVFSPIVQIPPSKLLVQQLHPFASGYTIFTGGYTPPSADTAGAPNPSCVSPDPQAWGPNSAGVRGHRQPAVATVPGGTVNVGVPMGIVTVTSPTNVYLTAVSAQADASVGDPGCSSSLGMSYSFGTVTSATSTAIALPFGTWQLYSGSSMGSLSTIVPSSAVSLPAGSPSNTGSGVFTLDPRVIAP